MKRSALLILLVFLAALNLHAQPRSPRVAASEQRVALVIGNDSYQHVGKLDNARADAQAIARGLERAGFKVTVKLDTTERAMKEAVRTFKGQINGGAVAVFYYSGHGVQLGASNYLLPTDIRAENEDQVRDEAMPLQRVLDDLQDQKTKFSLAIIDACRNNPFRQSGRAIGGSGLAPTTAATGQMILYSAGSGQQALDKLGPNDRAPNGLFTRVLLREMQEPDVPVDRVLRNVREEVVRLARTVNHEQVPAIYDQALGDFYFFSSGSTAQPTPASIETGVHIQTSEEVEQQLWDTIRDSRDPREFGDYLSTYPEGRFAAVARARLRTLSSDSTQVPAASPQQLPLAAPASLQQPAAEIEGFLQWLVGTWKTDCDKWTAVYREEYRQVGNELQATLVNAPVSSYRIDLASVKYLGEFDGMKRYSYRQEVLGRKGEKTTVDYVSEGAAGTRRILESMTVGTGTVTTHNGLRVKTGTPTIVYKKCEK